MIYNNWKYHTLFNLSPGISLTREMTPEERAHKFHTDDITVVIMIGESLLQPIGGSTKIWVVMHQQ